MDTKEVGCLNCGNWFQFNGASNDELGWHTVCPECGSSFDIDIEDYLVPNGTIVKFSDDKLGVIDGNDAEGTDEYDDINYYVCPIEETHKKVWSNKYIMLRQCEFVVVKNPNE